MLGILHGLSLIHLKEDLQKMKPTSAYFGGLTGATNLKNLVIKLVSETLHSASHTSNIEGSFLSEVNVHILQCPHTSPNPNPNPNWRSKLLQCPHRSLQQVIFSTFRRRHHTETSLIYSEALLILLAVLLRNK